MEEFSHLFELGRLEIFINIYFYYNFTVVQFDLDRYFHVSPECVLHIWEVVQDHHTWAVDHWEEVLLWYHCCFRVALNR